MIQILAQVLPAARCPRGRLALPQGPAKEEAKSRWTRLLTELAVAKVDAKPKKATSKKSLEKKVQVSKQGEERKKKEMAEVPNQETKEDLPAENGNAENERQASDKAEEIEAKFE